MELSLSQHLLENVKYIASPNCDLRPINAVIELLVIHNISLPPNEFGNDFITNLFTNSLDPKQHPYFQQIYTLQVSSHCLIRRAGEVIQYVPFNLRAWHAGHSVFNGKENCNDFSIGIELEGADHIPYTEQQYLALAQLITLLQQHYPRITKDKIVGHSDIAPKRKTDPGASFSWNKLFNLLAG